MATFLPALQDLPLPLVGDLKHGYFAAKEKETNKHLHLHLLNGID
jgi:hypothetical protein